jgi:CheY-like chemotaxis protein
LLFCANPLYLMSGPVVKGRMDRDGIRSLLLAEHNEPAAARRKRELELQGYRILHVSDGESALVAALDSGVVIDLILMDTGLGPGLTASGRHLIS